MKPLGQIGRMKRVTFINVGRRKLSWTAKPVSEISEDWLFDAVKGKKALMSTDLSFSMKDDRHGSIFAGFHHVGEFIVEDIEAK